MGVLEVLARDSPVKAVQYLPYRINRQRYEGNSHIAQETIQRESLSS